MKTFRNIALILLIVMAVTITTLCIIYKVQTSPVDKSSSAEIEVIIKEGISSKDIGKILKEKGLIRNANFFLFYVKLHNINDIKASTYKITKKESLEEIIDKLRKGNSYNPDEITITFKEGLNIRKIADIIDKNTENSYDDVFNLLKDETYINTLIEKYWFITDKIKNKDIYYSLEGYLFPDTYKFKNNKVTVKEIFEIMLNKMDKELSKFKDDITSRSLDVHEHLTLASVIELEGGVKRAASGEIINDDRPKIASVFYNRLKRKMSLGSDVTTYYAVKVEIISRELTSLEFNTYNPYNTRGPKMEGLLPVGPICSVGVSSIKASINPEETDYLYFVADKYNNTFFTKTYDEHLAKIKELKDKGAWYEYAG